MKVRLPLGALVISMCITVLLTLKPSGPQSLSPRPEGRHDRSGAMEALDFWTRARAYPGSDIPSDKYLQAYQISKMKHKEISRTISSGSIWDPIGPINLQGRSLSVAVNPQNHTTIYVGTASGGLWRSYTSGLGGDWEQIKLGFPALGVSSIVIDPSDSNKIYIGTGEVYNYQRSFGGVVVRTTRGSYGIGILKTTNGGATWTKSLDWTYDQQDGVQMLRMNPGNPQTIWAATTQGILKTVDAGANWTNVYPIFAVCTDIVIHSGDTNKVIAAVGNFNNPPTTLIRTTDGGANWNILGGIASYSGKAHLALYGSNPDIVYVSVGDSTSGVGALWRSTNFGDTWAMMSDYTTNGIFGVQGWYSHYVAVHPLDSSRVIHNSVGSSTSADGGVTFTYPSGNYSDNHGFAIDPVDPDIFYTVNDDGVYRSTNFGLGYTNVGYGMQTGQFYNGLSNSSQDSLLAIVQSQDHIPGYLYRNNLNWERTVLDEAGWTAIDPTNDNLMYAVDRYGGNFARSTNRGASFSYIAGFGGIGGWNSPIVVAPSLTATIYFADTRVIRSTNNGTSWTITNGGLALDGNPALSMAMSFTNRDTVYVGFAPIATVAHVFRTTNGGTGWTNVTGALPNRYPMDLAVDPKDSRVVYAAMGGFGSGHIFKTTNAGAAWADISGSLPDAPATAVVVDPLNSNIVYVGNDLGVYASTDGGSTWSAFSDGLPDAVIVADLTISPSNRVLRLATHGNGAYDRKMIGSFNPAEFDYKALSFVSPANGGTHDNGVPISPIRASFRNASLVTQVDSFNVKFRILDGATELFASTKRIPPLGAGESRTVTFDGSYTPTDTTILTLQAITLAADDSPTNDTLRGMLAILVPSMVNSWSILKTGCPYTEIIGGAAGPSGDDAQTKAAIPFAFKYDGYFYDSVQISTNGWLELGTGAPASQRGLTTSGQLGFYFSQALSSTARPTKVLGGWWTDMSTGSSSPGVISYITQGSAPDRVFVVQWKNMHAFYDETVSTLRVNFQIRLFEGSNRVEYHYGPVIAGTFPGYATGAAMGLKDYVGGDYRYFDLARMSSGLQSDLRTNLTPLADWPGQDSCFLIQTNPQGVLSHEKGWNLVSVPVIASDFAAGTLFAGQSVFRYTGGHYEQVMPAESLVTGEGYWSKFASSGNHVITGSALNSTDASVDIGWNLVGSVDHTVTAPSGGIITSAVYGYTVAGGYDAVTVLEPGRGYWLKTSSAGTVPIGPVAAPKNGLPDAQQFSALKISDNAGRSQTLYLAERALENVDPARYQLPPLPPEGTFSARFATGRMLEVTGASAKNVPIEISSALFPLTVRWKMNRGIEDAALVVNGVRHVMNKEGSITIQEEPKTIVLSLGASAAQELPTEFALSQNYPNPFNPATVIRYQIPVASRVTLKIYNTLGQEVTTLVDETQDPGFKQVEWDASNVPSGMYIYRLAAGAFTEVKKMVMLK